MKIFKFDEFCHDDFHFGLTESPVQKVCPLHTHDFCELVIVRRDSGLHVVGEEKLPIRAGDVFVVGDNISHAYRNVNDLTVFNILFRFDEMELPTGLLSVLPGYYALFQVEPQLRGQHKFRSRQHLSDEQLIRADLLLDHLRLELNGMQAGYQAAITGIFTELLVFLARCFQEESTGEEAQIVTRLSRVMSRIESQYTEQITLDDLARSANLSKRTLLRYFQNVYYRSPIHYLSELRLSKARELLLHTDLPVQVIGARVGFKDNNYFSRAFRKHTGMTSGEFRQKSVKP